MPVKVAQGFALTVALNLMLGVAGNVAILGGAMAATATVIEAVTRPIISSIFSEHPTIVKLIQIGTVELTANSLIIPIASWTGLSYKFIPTLTAVIFRLMMWFQVNQDFYEKNVGLVTIL